MATVKAEDLGPGVTSITWKGVIYTADADGNIEVDDEEFDAEHVKKQAEVAKAEAESKNRMATEAEPGNEPREDAGESAPAGQSDAEASSSASTASEGDTTRHRRSREG